MDRRAPRTSVTHPIRVDPVLIDVGPGRGRLGVTFLPGKTGDSVSGAPWARDLAVAIALTLARAGRHVVFHCRGGLGRAGTFAACALVVSGRTAEQAIAETRAARPGAIETDAQAAFVAAFGAF